MEHHIMSSLLGDDETGTNESFKKSTAYCQCCNQVAIYNYTTVCRHCLCRSCYMRSRTQQCPVNGCKNADIGEVKEQIMEGAVTILPHVFLLRKLTGLSSVERTVMEERWLLQTFYDFLTSIRYDGRTFPNTIEAFHVWSLVQDSCDAASISTIINGLQDGQSLPVYVRSQNASILITISDAHCDGHPAGSAIMSTFAASQRVADITLAPGELIGNFPTKSVHLSDSLLLRSTALARQIISLSNAEGRMMEDPVLVSKWLCGSLCGIDSCLCTDIPVVIKKVRDEVVSDIRRSGMWMMIKVVLQVLLIKEMGPVVGRQMYKLILLKFMCSLCGLQSINADVGVQMMAKIAGRVYKLYSLEDTPDVVCQEILEDNTDVSCEELKDNPVPTFKDLLKELLADAKATIGELRARLDAKWNIIVEEDSMKKHLNLSCESDFRSDCKHSLKPLSDYIEARKAVVQQVENGNYAKVPDPSHILNLNNLISFPFEEFVSFSAQGQQALEKLYFFEQNVLHMVDYDLKPDYCIVGKTFISYLKAAESAYKDDQIGMSRMVLVCLKIIRWVDQAVCGSHTLMREHETGIPIEIIEHLMLPFSNDLRLANELESYFTKRRSESRYPSLCSPYDFDKSKLYAVRHAAGDKDMQRKREEILAEGARRAAEKISEVELSYKEYIALKAAINRMRCKCSYTHNYRRFITCDMCNKERQANGMWVSIYEKPLPQRTEDQNAIVFELMIPKPIQYLREMLYAFLTHMGVLTPGSSCKTMWLNELSTHSSTRYTDSVLRIGRTSIPVYKSHCSNLHPREASSLFVVENTGNVLLCAGENAIQPVWKIPHKVLQRFVFRVESNSPYSNLQWALDDHVYEYSENAILAKQNECPGNLSLVEFKEFGGIRAGHRIQLRNLYRALKQETLTLKTDSVLNLIYEVLWRAGPRLQGHVSSSPSYLRDAHTDLHNKGFVMEFLQLLGNLIETYSNNWDDYNTYAAITAILLRIFAISEDTEVLSTCFQYLQNCRINLLKWCDSIGNTLDGMEGQSIAEQIKLRKILVAVASLCSCTYWLDTACHTTKDQLVEDVLSWLLAVKTIQEYMGEKDFVSSSSNTVRNQLRRVRECGWANFRKFHELIAADSSILQAFTEVSWSGLSRADSEDVLWECHKNDSQWFVAEVVVGGGNTVLQLDILEGQFLVNGKPQDSLPSQLKNHVDYTRIFEDFIIKVQPLTRHPWSAASKHTFHGKKMLFLEKLQSEPFSSSNPFIISGEINGNDFEYVPENAFYEEASGSQGLKLCMQQFLIRRHTHWWNKERQCIEFHSKKSHNLEYCLNLETGLIEETATKRMTIDNASPSYHQVMAIFMRFEQEIYIEIFYASQESGCDPGMLEVHLPRMRLTFMVKNNGSKLRIDSQEYPGMKLAEFQKCATLIGLNSGLMLEPVEKYFSNKVLLLPHGEVEKVEGSVKINTVTLRNPPYFAYEVDTSLWQLKCGQTKSASAYLAYLHAMNSYPLPDPFTGHTGTERSIQLLQSGHCWSCEPFDSETTRTLLLIAKLSPMRKYKHRPKGLTTVVWPLSSSMSCNDAFQLIVEKLIHDSQRLSALYDSKLAHESVKFDSEHVLCEKSYWRNFKCTTEQAHISPSFQTLNYPCLRHCSMFDFSFTDPKMNTVLKLVHLVDKWSITIYSVQHLHNFLVKGRPSLVGHINEFPALASIMEWQDLDFTDSWLSMYMLAKKVNEKNLREEWKMILSSYAFSGIAEQQLLLLHTIAVFPDRFALLNPPNCAHFEDPSKCNFDPNVVRSIIESNSVDCTSFLEKQRINGFNISDVDICHELTKNYEKLLASQVNGLTTTMQGYIWPFESCSNIVDAYRGDGDLLNLEKIKADVNIHLRKWSINYALQQFVNQVEDTVLRLNKSPNVIHLDFSDICQKLSPDTRLCSNNGAKKPNEFNIDKIQTGIVAPADLEEAKSAFQNGTIADQYIPDSSHFDILSDPEGGNSDCKIWDHLVTCLQNPQLTYKDDEKLKNRLIVSKEARTRYWNQAREMIMSDSLTEFLITAGIYQRIAPLTLLPLICREEGDLSYFLNCLRSFMGAFGVAETCRKYALRCLKYLNTNCKFELQRELDNAPHQNWSPAERPEWLLLEIEMDILVRPIQKQVAEWMEHPENGKNAVTQLNMGEGKTAVITPLILLSLTKKKQLCRITVLRSLYNTNRQALGLNLGGLLLNRRIYSFPCQRDFPFDRQVGNMLLNIYKECVEKCGINITTPEYRLSLQLKAYELCVAGQYGDATVYLQIQDWLKENARDILDESDEILHVKYQLVYALGEQMPLDGGSQRWTVLQRLLGYIPEVIKIIAEATDNGSVEIFEQFSEVGSFPPCRLCKRDIYDTFCTLLADRILSSSEFPNLQSHYKASLRNFLIKEVIDESEADSILDFLPKNSSCAFREKALMLRGLMACGVLFAAFNKRWRVNYGVNPNGRSLLAVPFRAKDVAAERAEFAHVDMALVLTHLSYYYSGLSESQVSECLYRLSQGPNPEMEYRGWIGTMKDPDPSIVSFRGINVEDHMRRNKKLFPALRKNKAVVDFWLGNIVLPVKIKQFPSKMLCTAWDLASCQSEKVTTGFSGTNDTQLLLPLTITQRDLPELKGTNKEVFQNILLEENNSYESLPLGAMSEIIIEKLVASNIPLLLDVGALMIDYNNETVAKKWLSLVSKTHKKAVIYFNAEDRLTVMDRSSLDPVPFEISPFRGMLEQCIIYLDDVHTRGTDLKFPSGFKGCVTLGKGITKDKLVQGCMRMRKLGKEHTICFWASDEVNNQIIAMNRSNTRLGSGHVFAWALNNSRNTMREGFAYLVAAACNYLSKSAARETYDSSCMEDIDRALLADQVSVREITELMEMYGTLLTISDFPAYAKQQLQKCNLKAIAPSSELHYYCSRLIEHCKTYVPDLKKNVHLMDEEQERELQQEIEEEREVERPGSAKPFKPKLDKDMVKFLKAANKKFECENLPPWGMRLPDSLKETRLASHNESGAWGSGIFVTQDFFNTIEPKRPTYPTDSYLRTANWIVSFTASKSQCWLLMSPFEVNELIPLFRSNQIKASLHMYAARLSPNQSTLLDLDCLVLPVNGNQPMIQIPGFYDLNASLSIFTGCTFFQDWLEFESYCAVTGYAPKPHNAMENEAMVKNLMDNTGYLLPSADRQKLRPQCQFEKNPDRLIIGIITCRYNHFSRLCHVARLVHECCKPTFND